MQPSSESINLIMLSLSLIPSYSIPSILLPQTVLLPPLTRYPGGALPTVLPDTPRTLSQRQNLAVIQTMRGNCAKAQSISLQRFSHKATERSVLHHLFCYLFPIRYQKEKGFRWRKGSMLKRRPLDSLKTLKKRLLFIKRQHL